MDLWEFVNSINDNKQNLMRDTENDYMAEKAYNPFMVNRALSMHQDTVYFANEMNSLNNLDKKLQYEYLLHIVRKRKRFGWQKNQVDPDVQLISKHFGYNAKRALEVLKLLTPEQLETIKKARQVLEGKDG